MGPAPSGGALAAAQVVGGLVGPLLQLLCACVHSRLVCDEDVHPAFSTRTAVLLAAPAASIAAPVRSEKMLKWWCDFGETCRTAG